MMPYVMLRLLLILPCVLAGTKLRYFREPSCNGNVLGDFSNDNSVADLDCHIPPRNITRAIFVDDIDSDCAIVTYSDYACSSERARRTFADKEMCFFSHKGGLLRSWRVVCGKEVVSLASAWELYRKTHVPEMPTPTIISGTPYQLTAYTSVTSWTTWNKTGDATMYATITKTGTVPVMTSTSTGAAHPQGKRMIGNIGAALIAFGGIAAAV